jgi:DNA-binding response OmpR family regulator
MEVAIAEREPTAADVWAYAAARRGHEVINVPRPDRLLGNLPFNPTTLILSLQDIGEEAAPSLRSLRTRFPDATVIVVYERASASSTASLLDAGADDVVRAPIAAHELILRAESWDRARRSGAPENTGLVLGDLEVDLSKYAVRKNNQNVVLTRLELRLLYCLCEHHPHLAPIDRLLTFGWEGMEEPDSSLIKTHISHIRKKLGEAGGIPVEIRSRQGVGYVLSVQT